MSNAADLMTPQGVQTLLQPKIGNNNSSPQVTCQVIHIRTVPSPAGDRHRVVLSDGESFVQGMLSTQLNHLVTEGALQLHGLVRIDEFMSNTVQNKRIIVLLKASALPNVNPGHRLGTPVDVSTLTTNQNNNTSAAAAAAAQPLYNSTNNANNNAGNGSSYGSKPNGTAMVSPTTSSSSSNPYGGSSRGSSSSAPIVRSSNAASPFQLISELNLYQTRWTIQARVTHKTEIKTWSNAKGEGMLFSVDLLDRSGVDIRATFFKEAVDKFFGLLQVSQVYTFSGGRLKVANARWNSCASPHEITFDENSEIHLTQDGSSNIQEQAYDFVANVAALESMPTVDAASEKPTTADVLAFVQAVGDVATLVSKAKGKEFQKCDVTLLDDSEAQITMTLWGEQANRAAQLCPLQQLIAVRRARLSDYGGGKSLSGPQSVTVVNAQQPSLSQLPATQRLQKWYQSTNGGQTATARSLSSAAGGGFGGPAPLAERQCIADIKRNHLGYNNPDKGDYISVQATLTFMKRDKEGGAWYPACPNDQEPCRQRCKVTPAANGNGGESWSCEKCMNTYDRCVRRWIFSAVAEDASGSTWLTFFNEAAEVLLNGQTADEVYAKSDGGVVPSDAYDSAFLRAGHTEWLLKCRCKLEASLQNEGETRVKASVQSIHPLDYVKESNELLQAIAQL